MKMLQRMAGILFSEKPHRDQEVGCHPPSSPIDSFYQLDRNIKNIINILDLNVSEDYNCFQPTMQGCQE